MAITLEPELETLLNEAASSEGVDRDTIAAQFIRQGLSQRKREEALQRLIAQSGGGATIPEFAAKMRKKYGFAPEWGTDASPQMSDEEWAAMEAALDNERLP